MSEIIDFYRGKNILITGATGFVGKLLMDKLLRLCDVGDIYIIIRDKSGLRADQRLDSIFQAPVFDLLRHSKPNFLNFIKVVKGDISLPGLGLSEDVRAMLSEKIDIVFHGAATMNFEEPIKRATSVNVCGTKEMALLCQGMKHLKAFVYISTAYSNCMNEKISERFYDPPMKADELINLCSSMSDGDSFIATEKHLKGWPNTYVFTKCVAEDVIRTYAAAIPTCIVRPAVVICTKSEPIEGWIDNYYGPTGYIAVVEAGVIRVAYGDVDVTAELVPADMCINVIMAAGYSVGKSGFMGETKIFNFVSSTQNRITYGEFADYFLEAGRHVPSDKAIWRPQLISSKSRILYPLLFGYHLIPAFILDMIQIISLKKPKALRTSFKMKKFVNALSYFAVRDWTFSNDNVISLWRELNPTDKVLFDFDVNRIDWKEMIDVMVRGVRKYLLNEHEQTIPMAKKRMYWLIVMDRTLQAFIVLFIGNLIAKY